MSKKILIVEDNEDLCRLYTLAFEEKGFTVLICKEAMNAVRQAESDKPDIVLLDIMMPFVSGYDFLKILRSKGNDIKIVVNSNLSQENDIQKAKEFGADLYLMKADFTPNQMVKKVEEFLK